MTIIVGWDIGGAHLKAAVLESPTEILSIQQQPCPLWQGIEKLEEAFGRILSHIPDRVDRHIVTMTGELVDLFESRDDGVMRILQTVRKVLKNNIVIVYAGRDGFIEIDQVEPDGYAAIASANWLASATWAAQKLGSGLLVDIGSTTTDILWFGQGEVYLKGYTDYERLISQELVYTGIVRTPIMSVSQYAEDRGERIGLMAEYFATMADVYRVTGELNELHDQADTADGAEKTVAASAKRLARMIGCDYFPEDEVRWRQFAHNIRQQQLIRIQDACRVQMSRAKNQDKQACFCGAGIGRFLVREVAGILGQPYFDFSGLIGEPVAQSGYSAADCAPAVAVACLFFNSQPL